MTVIERDEYRLNILKKLCEATEYNCGNEVVQTGEIIELFGLQTDEEYETFLGAIDYLKQKGYLTCEIKEFVDGSVDIYMLKLTAHGLDVVERMERKAPLAEYENDFSKEAVVSVGNIQNSSVIINSPNASVTFNQIVRTINQLDDSILESDDKEALISLLQELDSAQKTKESKWNKAKGILKWLADKSVDVGIAALPYILDNLRL